MTENSTAEAFSLLGISLIVILLRLISRISLLGIRQLQLDDYLMAVAGCLYSAETVAAYYVVVYKGLTNGTMTEEERAALNPGSQEYHDRVSGSKTQLMGWIVYTVLLWTLKICMLCFYARLTNKVRSMTIRVKIGAYLLPITFLTVICVELFACSPVQKHWQIYPDPGSFCHPAHSFPSIYTLIVLNVSTDFYLMYIPLPMVLKARLPTKKKLGLVAMFTGGLFATTAGFLRCVLIITSGPSGAQQAGAWSCRESCIAVCVSNVPMIYPFVARIYHRVTLGKESIQSRQANSYRLGPLKESAQQSFGKKRPSPYSIPQTTLSESRDRITMMPATVVEVEAEYDTDSARDTASESNSNNIKVVTKIGVKSSAHRELQSGQNNNARRTDGLQHCCGGT